MRSPKNAEIEGETRVGNAASALTRRSYGSKADQGNDIAQSPVGNLRDKVDNCHERREPRGSARFKKGRIVSSASRKSEAYRAAHVSLRTWALKVGTMKVSTRALCAAEQNQNRPEHSLGGKHSPLCSG
jgi:hypothetical protein